MLNNIKVLIVDHNDPSRRDVSNQLKSQNYSVVEASCECEALKFKPYPFDVVIMDVNLPHRFQNVVQDGLGVTMAMALRKNNPSIGILFYSSDERYTRQAEDLYRAGDGGVGYISKEGIFKIVSMLPAVIAGNWICALTKPSGLNSNLEDIYLHGLADTPRKIVVNVVERLYELKENETLILQQIGESNQSIAQNLNLAINTVETKLTIIYSKLGLEKTDRRLRSILLDRALSIFNIRKNRKG